jgi:3-(3-hydroxy-phenyl)propionate hydroxylase
VALTRPIVVAGGGPCGLAIAVALARAEIPVIVVERGAALATDLRAGSFHPPTIEMFDQLGVGDDMRAMGIQVSTWQIRDRHAGVVAEFDLGMLTGDTPYPFRLHCEQHKLSALLARELEMFDCAQLRYACCLVDATQSADWVTVHVETPDGPETIEASWLIGADGARSAVRRCLGTEFEGFTWPERLLVLSTTYDLAEDGFALNCYIADPQEWCAIFKMPHDGPPGIWRVAFPTDTSVPDEEVLDLDYGRRLLNGFLPRRQDYDIPYRSTYRVHQRVAKTFRSGRILLAGDAAHINNPLGGMGLNSAIHDAMNLAPRLIEVHRDAGADADALLDQYVRQRRQTNLDFVQADTIRNKKTLEERDESARRSRLQELAETAADTDKAYRFLLRSSMIASVRRAAEIA